MIKVSGHHIRLSHPSCIFVPMLFDGNRCDVLGILCRWKDGALPDVSSQVMSNYVQDFKCNSRP
jgi:hypothetical protein